MSPPSAHARTVALKAAGYTYLLAFCTWFLLEMTAAHMYFPAYSYRSNLISELGIPYIYFGAHWVDYSRWSWLMNANFFLSAGLYSVPQGLLLYATFATAATSKDSSSGGGGGGGGYSTWQARTRAARAALALLFLVGLVLVGAVHGGPREHKDGSVLEHEIGAALAIVGGNLGSILSGLAGGHMRPLRPGLWYRASSVALGVAGIGCVLVLVTLSAKEDVGLWERGSVYTIFAWELSTALLLLAGRLDGLSEEAEEEQRANKKRR